jgi:sugar lactone lactonase YvrE
MNPLTKSGGYDFLFIGLFLFGVMQPCVAQQTITLNRELSGSVSATESTKTYTFSANRGDVLELTLNIKERDFSLAVSVLNVLGQVVEYSEGTNYPHFSGVYMQFDIPLNGNYSIRIEAFDIATSTPYTLLLRALPADEQQRTIALFESKSGIIGRGYDQDEFIIAMRRGNPALFVVTTPNNILDSLVAVIDPQGNLAALNYDFFGTMSVVMFNPEISGNYYVIVAGQSEQAIGPYTLIVNPVASFSAPFTNLEEIILPGDTYVYAIGMMESKTYDISVTGVDDFRPFIALMDAGMNVIARSYPVSEIPIAAIPGFTPLADESLYLFVMGETTESIGPFQVDVAESQDEEDGLVLSLDSSFAGVIGPVGDVDEYVFAADANENYSILVTSTWHYLDPAMRILDPDGAEIFFNDDAANGVYSLFSNIRFPASADYKIQIMASPIQEIKQSLTGVYLIQMATGATFDRYPPRIFEPAISVEAIANGARIRIPTYAVLDDTYPLSATLTYDKEDREVAFDILRDTPVELDIASQPDEIFFLVVSDSADRRNAFGVTLPPPTVIAALEGTPYGMAIDAQNNLYITDADIGGVYKVTIDGATEYILLEQGSGGGILGPNALAFDAVGSLYLSNGFTHSIVKVLPDGSTESYAGDLNFPVDIAFDPDGVLYVAQIGSDTVDKIFPDGSRETFVATIRNPNGLTFSPDGQLYVCNNDRGQSSVYRILPDGTAEPFVENFTQTLEGMAFDEDGYLYAADGILGVVYRISPDGDLIVLTRGLSGAIDLAFGYGPYAKTLFASNMGIEADGFYVSQIIAIPTGRRGVPLPYGTVTDVKGWKLY